MDETTLYWVIAATFFGFITLAFVLLFPVYRFLRKEEKQSEVWTKPALAEHKRRTMEQPSPSGDGTETEPPPGPGAPGEPPELAS